MPAPITTAQRSAKSPFRLNPASRTASRAATNANWLKRSSKSRRFASKWAAGSYARTCAATWINTRSAGKPSSGAMPDSPARNLLQKLLTSRPRADIAPRPVTTTRRISSSCASRLLGQQILDSFHRLAHAADLLGLLVGDLDVEFVLQGKK